MAYFVQGGKDKYDNREHIRTLIESDPLFNKANDYHLSREEK